MAISGRFSREPNAINRWHGRGQAEFCMVLKIVADVPGHVVPSLAQQPRFRVLRG